MRRAVLLLCIVAGLASPSWAANQTQVSVAQLSQWLAGVHRQSDSGIAAQLESMVLTERVSAAQLTRWQSALHGSRSRQELTVLADSSAFLDPPATGLLPDPPADLKAQGAILSNAIDYVVQTLAKLPDFFATRTTVHFEDTPAHAKQVFGLMGPVSVAQRGVPYEPLRQAGQSSVQVSYLNGVETHGVEKMERTANNRPVLSLTTAGEFGPILSVVLDDSMHGAISWGYWQQSQFGKLAVFRYSVPEVESHYVLTLHHAFEGQKFVPAYHGEIAVDPASGAVLRITVVTAPVPSNHVEESAIAVDYAKVELGSKNYICPIKGVALLKTDVDTGSGQMAPQVQLNDVTFTAFHLARGDVRILPAP